MPMLRFGDAQISRAEELLMPLPLATLGQEAAFIDANRDWLFPRFLDAADRWAMCFQSWIVQLDGKVVVVDPCNGNDRPHSQPWFDQLKTPFIERFCATGVRPEDVDYVFCTHMHHDHCGWNVRLSGGRWVPTFPNARYLFLRREYERWDPNGAEYRYFDLNEGVYERSILPIVEAGLADLVMDAHRISESLEILAAPGHTFGHAMLRLSQRADEALFTGDVFHHPLQLTRPEFQFGDCDDLVQATETRRRLVARALERDSLIVPAHLPFPHAGRVRRRESGVIFESLQGAWEN